MPDAMLTQQLRELESDELLIRTVSPVVPPKVEYSLTEKGVSLRPVLEAMFAWGNELLKSEGVEANCSMVIEPYCHSCHTDKE